jgi:hypothetical protein
MSLIGCLARRWASRAELLPPGASTLALADFEVPAGEPGVFLIEAVLIDPLTGRDLARHVLGVVRQ